MDNTNTPATKRIFDARSMVLGKYVEWLLIAPLALVAALGGYAIHERMLALDLAEQQIKVSNDANSLALVLESQLNGLGDMARSLAIVAKHGQEFINRSFPDIASELVGENPAVIDVILAPSLVEELVYPVKRPQDNAGSVLSDPNQHRDVASRAIDTRQVTIGGPFASRDGAQVLVASAPFSQTDPAGGGRILWGVVSVTADVDTIMGASGVTVVSGDYDISFLPRDVKGDANRLSWGVPDLEDREPLTRDIAVPGGTWQLLVAPKAGWIPTLDASEFRLLAVYAIGLAVVLISMAAFGQASRQRREIDNQLREAIDALDHGFVIFDSSDRFVMCNQAFRKFYSASADLLRPGVPFRNIITEGIRRGQILTTCEDDQAWIEERMILHNTPNSQSTQQLLDGTWLQINERRLTDGSAVGLRIDITDIIEAHAEAEKAYKAKSEFISVLSHELRTPLTVILGYAKVLSHLHMLKNYQAIRNEIGSLAEYKPEFAALLNDFINTVNKQGQKIDRSGRHLLILINDLLDYSKIEAGHFELNFEPTELRSICETLIDEHSGAAEEKGIVLIDEIRNLTVELDPVRFKQVMINLLGNAIKFTDSGSITLRSSFGDGMVRVDVEDTGCGVDPAKIESIFEAFQQADYSDTRRAGGTGLGLAISRQIVALHGGTLTVTSNVGEGSCFSVEIPIQRVTEDGLSEIRPRSVVSRFIA